MPKPLQEETNFTDTDGICELLTKRNDSLINSYNPIQLSAWRANVDMQYLYSRQKVVEYCAKYATKCEPRSQTMQETFHIIVNGLKEGTVQLSYKVNADHVLNASKSWEKRGQNTDKTQVTRVFSRLHIACAHDLL